MCIEKAQNQLVLTGILNYGMLFSFSLSTRLAAATINNANIYIYMKKVTNYVWKCPYQSFLC